MLAYNLRCVCTGAFAATRSVDKRCALWPGRRRCIHKFIMLLSRTSTDSESAVFFMKPAETDHLQDFENRNNTSHEECIV